MSGAPILSVDHLSMRFGGIVAVNDLSFAAGRRKITALIGHRAPTVFLEKSQAISSDLVKEGHG